MNKNPRTDALLAVLPHIDIRYRKEIAIMVKMMEIKEICRYYDSLQAKDTPQGSCRHGMIEALMPHVNEKNREMMQTMLQMMEMKDLMEGLQ